MLAIGVCFVILLSEHVIFQDHAYDQATQGRPRGGHPPSGKKRSGRRSGNRRNRKTGRPPQGDPARTGRMSGHTEPGGQTDRCIDGSGTARRSRSQKSGSRVPQGAVERAECRIQRGFGCSSGRDRHPAELPGRHRARRQNGGRQSGCETGRKLYAIARKPAAPLGAGPQIRHHRLRPGRKAHRRGVPRL